MADVLFFVNGAGPYGRFAASSNGFPSGGSGVGVTLAVAASCSRLFTVHKLLDFVLAVTFLVIFYETIKMGVKEYKELNILNTLVSFMIPIVYLIILIPLEYSLELYAKYEALFARMTFKEEKNKKVKRRHRISIIKACKLSVYRVLLFQKEYCGKMYVTMKDEQFEELMKEFKEACLLKKNKIVI